MAAGFNGATSMASGPTPSFLAVDWGTTRLRASLVEAGGAVIDRTQSDHGVQSVPAGGFPVAFAEACGPWLRDYPGLPVLMAGMVGSRNGWIEAPYAPCPSGPADLAARLLPVPGMSNVSIVPGVDCRSPDGAYDVMRGEETQVIGTGVVDGLVCLPGTHSKWVLVQGGRIIRFVTFITGELYAAMTASFVGRLAAEPADMESGHAAGEKIATLGGGLGRLLFQARTQVLGNNMPGAAVKPFLSSLLVGQEIAGAIDLFGKPSSVHLVAATPQREVYEAALKARGFSVTTTDPADAVLAGQVQLFNAPRG